MKGLDVGTSFIVMSSQDGDDINFVEIMVYNIKSGKPGIKLLGKTKKIVNINDGQIVK